MRLVGLVCFLVRVLFRLLPFIAHYDGFWLKVLGMLGCFCALHGGVNETVVLFFALDCALSPLCTHS